MAPDEPTFVAGLVLDGRYRLEHPLGQGGMGTVWVGQQLTLGRKVAIKALRAGRSQLAERLEREARLLASVRHPSIVQIHDFGAAPGGLSYVVMELVEGLTLEATLSRHRRLSCVDAVSILLPVIDGLTAVHAAGIVHRDVKPANILLSREVIAGMPQLVPKLLDFGIAKSEHRPGITHEGDLIGTPAYMAPEQLAGLGADARADVWGVGATLYDLIAGEPPFIGGDLFELMRRAKEDPPPFPTSAIGLDGKLWSVLVDALQKRREDRIASASLLGQRLADWLAAHGGPRLLDGLVPDAPRVRAAEAPETLAAGPTSFDDLIRHRLKET